MRARIVTFPNPPESPGTFGRISRVQIQKNSNGANSDFIKMSRRASGFLGEWDFRVLYDMFRARVIFREGKKMQLVTNVFGKSRATRFPAAKNFRIFV
ncbi:hypothetical protein CEXT_430531 [Caerostris extrusa]|uniref:Uncharacterized protein n=1 Tax=Caerostris extrusa TaxID=172846 RepID=A0AAV4XR02_CAEEX|nr:hypothetical protein CEXT_430531 [Caerostris extrusa]